MSQLQTVAMDGIENLSSNETSFKWNNYQNAQFYENIPLEILQNYAKIGGLESGIDIDLITPYIINTKSILEVGAGYGRAINHLLQRNYTGEIFALERCTKYIDILEQQFKNRINLYFSDLHSFQILKKFDAILWLWSGICEFTKYEQLAMIKKLFFHLNDNGVLIIDTMPALGNPINLTHMINNYKIIKGNNWIMRSYFPSDEDMQNYMQKLDIIKNKKLDYLTSTKRERLLYIINK